MLVFVFIVFNTARIGPYCNTKPKSLFLERYYSFGVGGPSIWSCAPNIFKSVPKILAVRLKIYTWSHKKLPKQNLNFEPWQVVFDSLGWSSNSCQKLKYVKQTSNRLTDQLNGHIFGDRHSLTIWMQQVHEQEIPSSKKLHISDTLIFWVVVFISHLSAFFPDIKGTEHSITAMRLWPLWKQWL